MTFHYIRKNDTSGTIQRVNGMGVGLALQKVIASNRTLPLATSVEVLRFAADILNEAMKSRVIHGDIKIENLAVMNDGSLIINGFDRPRRNSITPEGMISHEGDIYGLGLVMLELLSGQRNIELPLDEGLHNQKVLQTFLTIDWQEWTQQPWLSTMQEYLISLLFYDKTQRPHPLDIANILKEASQTTASLGIQQYMQHKGLRVSMEQESLEMARTLRSSTLISTVEVTADSEGTATGFFTRDKIAEMFQEPVPEERARRTEWSPDSVPSHNQGHGHGHGHSHSPTRSQGIQDSEASLDLSPQEVAQASPPLQQPTWSNPTPPPVPSPTPPTNPAPPPWQATPPTPPTPPVQSTQTPNWQNVAATELPTSTNPAPPPWQTAPPTPPTPPTPPRTQPIQEQPTPSLPPPIASNRPQNNIPPLPVPTPPTPPTVPSINAGVAPEQPAWSNPTPPPQPNFAIGAGNQSVAPPPMPNTTSPNSGGINKWVLIGGAGVGLLLLVIAVLVWQLLSNDGDEANNAEIAVETINVEKIEPEEIEEVEEEEAEPAKEPAEEVKDTKPEPKPKPKVIKKSSKPAPKSTRTSTKKPSKPTKSTTKSTPAPTTVGVGEFTVTISFQKEATLECGDGQTKDFVRQTKMTFTTPTACRISTEDGERGALTARKSGTMTCTLAGSRIRCK